MNQNVKSKTFEVIDLHDFMDVMEKLDPETFDRDKFWEEIPFSFGDLDMALVNVHRLARKMFRGDDKTLNLIEKNFDKDVYIDLEG